MVQKTKNIVNIKAAFLLFFIMVFMASNIYVLVSHFQIYTDRSNKYAHIPIEVYPSNALVKIQYYSRIKTLF